MMDLCCVHTPLDWLNGCLIAWLGWLFDSAAVSDPERPVAEHSAGVQDGPQGQGGHQASFTFCVPRPWRVVASHGFSASRGEALVLLLLLMVVGMVATLKSGGWSLTLSRQRCGIDAVAVLMVAGMVAALKSGGWSLTLSRQRCGIDAVAVLMVVGMVAALKSGGWLLTLSRQRCDIDAAAVLMVVGMVAALKSGGWSWTLSRQRCGIDAVAAVNGGGHGGSLQEWWLIMDYLQAEVGGGSCGGDLKGWWLDKKTTYQFEVAKY